MTRLILAVLTLTGLYALLRRRSTPEPDPASWDPRWCVFQGPTGDRCGYFADHIVHECAPWHAGLTHPNIVCHEFEPDPYAEPVPMAAWDGTARCCAMGVDDPEHMVCTGYREHGWDILCHPYGVPDPMQRTYTTSSNSATYLYNARTGVLTSYN